MTRQDNPLFRASDVRNSGRFTQHMRAIAFFGSMLAASVEGGPLAGNLEPRSRAVRADPLISVGARGLDDCNENSVPDDEDMENCPALPSCDDCNLNGLPDECDVNSGTSLDTDMNGVPDECVSYDGGGTDDNWSTDANWDGDSSPNNPGPGGGLSATVGSSLVLLDVNVELNTFRLLDGATLFMVGSQDEDLKLVESGGLLVRSTISAPSRLFLGESRTLDVTLGMIRVRGGGIIEAAPAFAAGVSQATGRAMSGGQLIAAAATIESRCGESAAELNLTGTMSAVITGNLVIDASQDCVDCAFCPPVDFSQTEHAIVGGETPPIVRGKQLASLNIGGDLIIKGEAALHYTSAQPLVIGGSFINQGSCPDCIILTGPVVLGASPSRFASQQYFEVAHSDVGLSEEAIRNGFSSIDLTSNSAVIFVNAFANYFPPISEALYVHSLILRKGSTLTIDGCSIYYHSLVDEGGTISLTNDGTLVQVPLGPSVPAACPPGMLALSTLLVTTGVVFIRLNRRLNDHQLSR